MRGDVFRKDINVRGAHDTSLLVRVENMPDLPDEGGRPTHHAAY
jgi:hypothetical protein